MSLSQTITYDDPLDFTFDTSLIDVIASAKLKALVHINELAFASYHSSVDIWRSAGTKAGTAVGGASVAGGKLNLKGNTVKYVSYDASTAAIVTQTGTMRLKYIPNYTGNPVGTKNIFTLAPAAGNNNVIEITHRVDSKFQVDIYNSAGALIMNLISLSHSATAGTPIDIELDMDLAGTTRLFVDGVEILSSVATGTRTAAAFLYIGTNRTKLGTAESEIDFWQITSDIKHTANFTPAPEPTDYSLDNPSIIVNVATILDAMTLFSEVAVKVGADEIKYTLQFGGQDKYWTGAAWADSNGTYAQASTAADINTNVATLDLSVGGTLKVKAFLHSDDGYMTPELTSNTYTYSFYVLDVAPNECMIYGRVKDSEGEGVLGVKVEAIIKKAFYHGESLIADTSETLTKADGYWELSLVETATITQTVLMVIEGRTKDTVIIPDQFSAPLSILV